ncbi:DUF6615 family protein [Micromonospora sp. NPDC004540]|uniref:DUF6615 family protein n=1 Tax=Micromonospora sp. NPDC004540 TaxID=3154457 RepID=UPI0033B614D0
MGALRRDMNDLAVETWRKIETGDAQGLTFGENSLTDHNLWTLAQKHPGLNVHRFSQNREKETGADWEWWIGSMAQGWLCLRVQAKRAYRRTYPELDHAGNGDDDYQYDTLINSCNVMTGEYPLHVFYNGWKRKYFGHDSGWAAPAKWRACSGNAEPGKCWHAHPVHYGCAVASSFAVKAVHDLHGSNRRMVTAHLSWALPWSYLFGRSCLGRRVRTDAAEPKVATGTPEWLDWVQANLDSLVGELPADAGVRPRLPGSRQTDDRRQRRAEQLPAYANAVRRGTAQDSIQEISFLSPAASCVIVLDLDEERGEGDDQTGDFFDYEAWKAR